MATYVKCQQTLVKWKTENPQPAKIFSNKPSLKCKVCEKELLYQEDKGVITLWHRIRHDYNKEPQKFEHVFWTCRGRCDDVLSQHIRSQTTNLIDGWEDISDVMMPTIFIKWVMSIMNEKRDGVIYSDEAFNSLKEFLLQVFLYISRHLTTNEDKRVKSLIMIPASLGGMGYDI
ncbi:hypothetical protein [Nitrosomonas communis]|uniref:hypothetical protein n=1 Tax=Nitrosomonas communis TaxID=44574 RepID=UPI003D277EBA